MEKKISGQLLFLYFALPCKKFRLEQNPELADDFKYLEECVKNGNSPGIESIEKGFPAAVRHYRECQSCKESGYQADFSYASVENHWRYHHDRGGDCAVRTAMILTVNNDGVVVICESKTFAVSNPRGITLEQFSSVLIHHSTIVMEDKMEF